MNFIGRIAVPGYTHIFEGEQHKKNSTLIDEQALPYTIVLEK